MVIPVSPAGYDSTRINKGTVRALAALPPLARRRLRHALRGMGDATTDSGTLTWDPGFVSGAVPTGTYANPSTVDPTDYLAYLVQQSAAPGSSELVPTFPSSLPGATSTGMDPQQLALLNSISQGGFTLAKELAIQPGVTVSPTGAVSQQNPGYPIGTTAGSLSVTGQGSSMLILAAAAVAVVLLMQRK